MAIIGVVFGAISLLIGIVAFCFSIVTYLARNRPFVAVTSLSAHDLSGQDEKELTVKVQNVGEVPAVDVSIKVRDSGGAIENADFFLGAIFPGLSASIWFPVPEALIYYSDKELSYSVPIPPEELEERERRGLRGGTERYIDVFPEGYGATAVICHITYKEPLRLPFKSARTFKTIQPFRIDQRGRYQPARSKQAKIT